MPARSVTLRGVRKKGRPRVTKPERDKAAAKALCTEIAMLAAAKGWGRKPGS